MGGAREEHQCGKSWLSEALMEPWAVQFVFEPISLSSNPWIPEPVIKLAAPWGACLYPQTGPSPLVPRSTLAPQMGIDGRDRGTPGLLPPCQAPHRPETVGRAVNSLPSGVERRDGSPAAWRQGGPVGPSPGHGLVQLVRFLFRGPGDAQQRGS